MKSMRGWMLGTAATVLVAFALIQAPSVFADACVGAADGNWNVDATWSTCHEGTGSPYPQAGDTVDTGSAAITVNVNSAATSVAVTTVGIYFGSLTVNSGVTLTLSGTTTTTLNLTTASNTATINGTVTMSADGGGVTNAGTVTVSSTGTLKTKGGLAGAGTYTFDAASTVVYNKSTGDTIASGKTYGNLTLGDSGTTATYTAGGNFTAAGTLTVDTGDLLAGSTATITLSGSGTPFSMGGADRFTEATSTISYTSGSGATVTNTTYNNLTINGTGTFNLSGDLTISGNLSVLGGTLAYTANLITMPSGSLTVTSPGVFSGAGNSRVLMYGSNITVGGTGTSTFWMLDVGKGDGTGSTTLGVSGDLTINGHMSIFNTIGTNTLNANSYTITFPGNDFGEPFYIPTATGTVFNAGTSTIVYSGNNAAGFYGGNMQLAKVTYYNLQLNNAAETYQIGADLVVNNTVDVTAGTFALGNYNLTVGASGASGVGHLIGSGTITQSAGATTTLKGQGNLRSTSSSSCTTPGAGSFTFNNLTLGDGTNSRTSTVCGDITVSNNLTVQTSHTLTVGSNNLTVGSLGTLYTSGGIAQAFDTDKLSTDFTQSTASYFTYDSVNKWVHAAGGSGNTVAGYVTSLSQSAGKVRASVKSMDTSVSNRAGVIGLYGSSKGVVGYFRGGGTPTVAIATVDFSTTTVTEQTTASYTMTSGDVIRLDITGNSSSETVTLYVNDVQKTQWAGANLSAYTGTSWGIFHANGTGGGANKPANWDDVEVANIYGFGLAGNMVGAGTISQTGGTTTFKGAYLRSSSTSSCAAPASGSFTFNALSLGNASNTVTNTACGSLTAASLTITASDTFNAGSGTTITLTGSGTPLTISGTFTPSASTLLYNNSASGATVTATTFYNLTLGDGSSSKTFTAAGDLTVQNVLTVDTGDTFNANSRTITLGGTTTPFVLNGSFTPGSGSTAIMDYSGSGAKVTATTYHHLQFDASATLGTASGQTITTNGKITVNTGTVNASTYNPTIAVNGVYEPGGTGTAPYSAFYLAAGTSWTKGTGTITFGSSATKQEIWNLAGSTIDLGPVISDNGITNGLVLAQANTVTSLTVNASKIFSLNGVGLTVTGGHINGSGTLYCGAGNNTCSAGTTTLQGTGYLRSTGSGSCVTPGSGAFTFYNLTLGDGATSATTTTCDSFAVSNALTVNASHTLALQAFNPSVGTAASNGHIVGAGAITSSASGGTLTLIGTGNLGGTSTSSCTGDNGSYTFYNLTVGNGSDTKTTTLCGNVSVSNVFTLAGSHTLTDGNYQPGADTGKPTLALTGTGTPFVIQGTFSPVNSFISYQGTSANVTATTYAHLKFFGAGGTYTLGTASGQTITTSGKLFVNVSGITLKADTWDPNVVINGSYTGFTFTNVALRFIGGTTWTKGASGTLTFGGSVAQVWQDEAGTTDIGKVVINNSNAAGVTYSASYPAAKATSVTINASKKLDISGGTLTLTGTGSPLAINGTLTENSSSTVEFAAPSGSVTVPARTYGGTLKINGAATFNGGGATTANNAVIVNAGTLAMGANDLTAGATTVTNSGSIQVASAAALSQSSGNTTTMKSSASGSNCIGSTGASCAGTAGSITLGSLTFGDGATTLTTTFGGTTPAMTVSNTLTIADAAAFNAGTGSTITLSGNVIPLQRGTGTFTAGTSTVEYTSGSGVFSLTSGAFTGANKFYNLTIAGAGSFTSGFALDAGGNVTVSGGTLSTSGSGTVTGTLTVSGTGTFPVSTNTLTAGNVTVSGGTLSINGSGGKLQISGGGTFSMSGGTFQTSNVATAPQLTTSDTATPTYIGVSVTGGTLDVSKLQVDYLKTTGFVINPSPTVTITNFNNVRWGDSSGVYHGQAGTEMILDVTATTVSLLSHIFPTTWASFGSGDCNVRASTSGTVTMWDWTGTFGGEQNDCDNGGEVIWQGGAGAHGASGSPGYPAIY